MIALALGFLLGAASVIVAQSVYLRRQLVRERESLVELRDTRAEVPGGVVVELYRYQQKQKRSHHQ